MNAKVLRHVLLGPLVCLSLLALAVPSALGQATDDGDATDTLFETAPELWKGCGLEKLTPEETAKLSQAIDSYAEDLARFARYYLLASAKTTTSGLEGVMRISVRVVSEKGIDELIDPDTVKSLVELQIRKADVGLTVTDSPAERDGCLYLYFTGVKEHYLGGETGRASFTAKIEFWRNVFLVAPGDDGPVYLSCPLAGTYGGLGGSWLCANPAADDEAKRWAEEQVDVFLNEWMKANPKEGASPVEDESLAPLRGTGGAHVEDAALPRSQGGLVTKGVVYLGVGAGHWIQKVIDRGEYIKLEDGSLWAISTLDRIDTCIWLPIDDITVIENDSGLYPYKLVNTDRGETAEAVCLSR